MCCQIDCNFDHILFFLLLLVLQDSAEGSSDEDLDSEGEKHVAFIVNEAVAIEMAENQFNDDVCRLQRKDTPHHFKGKRIVNDDSDKERLQEILSSIENRKSSEADDDEDAVDGVVEMEKVSELKLIIKTSYLCVLFKLMYFLRDP